jgi:hypothetical protein
VSPFARFYVRSGPVESSAREGCLRITQVSRLGRNVDSSPAQASEQGSDLQLSSFFESSVSGVALITGFSSRAHGSLRPLTSRALSIFSLAVLIALAGCGGSVKPQIGPIEFTNAAGTGVSPVTSLAVNGQIFLVATVTHDDQLLGVSWTVNCGSAVPPSSGTIDTSCGTCVPAQTQSGPVPLYPSTGIITTYNAPSAIPKGATVTITAHATALPSVSSSVTLTIVAAQAANPARGWPQSGAERGQQGAGM